MKLTDAQWGELKKYVADDDKAGFEALVQIVVNFAELQRERERAEAERIVGRPRKWLPEER